MSRPTENAPSSPDTEMTVERFALSSRIAHWVLAVPFLFLLGTGLALYVPDLKAVHLGGYRLFALLHVVAGILMLASPIVLLVSLSRAAKFRSDLAAALKFEAADHRWLNYAFASLAGSRRREPATGKFNAGQKLNTIFNLAITAGLLGTGAVLAVNYFARGALPPAFVEGVFPWHTRLMLLSLPVIAGHIYLALIHPTTRHALPGIIGGRVNRSWALRHHRLWIEQLEAPSGSPQPETRSSS